MTRMDGICLYITQNVCSLISLKTKDAPYYNISWIHHRKGAPSLYSPHHVNDAMPYAQQSLVTSITFAV